MLSLPAHPPRHPWWDGWLIEVYETKFGGKRKYARGMDGRFVDIWLLTMIERRRQLFTCMIVQDRSADSLLLLICRHITPSTIILSEEWRSYLGYPISGTTMTLSIILLRLSLTRASTLKTRDRGGPWPPQGWVENYARNGSNADPAIFGWVYV